MKRLYFNIDKDNKVILDRKDFNYLMSIGHYNDKAIEYIKNYYFYNSLDFDVKELLDILKGKDNND